MSRLVQGAPDNRAGIARKTVQYVGVVVISCLLLSGCGAGSMGLAQRAADSSIVTGSVSAVGHAGLEVASDTMTILNAVSSVDIGQVRETGIAWANADTGSAGTVSEIEELTRNDTLCRRFVARRESFDGVALYRGEACHGRDGQWKMQDFEAV